MAKRLGNMLAPIRGKSGRGQIGGLFGGDTDPDSDRDDVRQRFSLNNSDNTNMSVVSDNATLSGASVALTINSNDTVKASNRQGKKGEGTPQRQPFGLAPPPSKTPERKVSPEEDVGFAHALDAPPPTTTPSAKGGGQANATGSSKKWHKKLKRLVAGSAKPNISSSASVGVGYQRSKPISKSAYDVMSIPDRDSRLRARIGSADEPTVPKPNRRGLRTRSSGSLDRSDGSPSNQSARHQSSSARHTSQLDAAIRGRLDGMDILALGPAGRISLPVHLAADVHEMLSSQHSRANEPVTKGHHRRVSSGQIELREVPPPPSRKEFNTNNMTFTDAPIRKSTDELVLDMIWTSAGREPPEVVLEGFVPGGADRWSVRMENPAEKEKPLAPISPDRPQPMPESAPVTPNTSFGCGDLSYLKLDDTYDVSCSTPPRSQLPEEPIPDDGSPGLPTHKLWDKIWGDQEPPPIPTHMLAAPAMVSDSDIVEIDDAYSDDRILQMAAEASVPIDLDEDTFMVDDANHLRSVHDIAMIPLQQRNIGTSLVIFRKLLQSLEVQRKPSLAHLLACTNHNIGLLHMCQSEFAQALDRFHNAVRVRRNCLPMNHPDIAVSLQRQGMAYFAMNNVALAVKSFAQALSIILEESASRAKLLNNLGVVHAHRGDRVEALKLFTNALEIQRQWLDGPVRRESIVYDASITLGNMGKVYLEQTDYDLAYYVFEEACLLQTTTFRKDHDIVLSSLENLAFSKLMSQQHKKAMQIYSSILRLQVSRFGPESRQATETSGTMAYLHVKEQNMDAALSCLVIVQKWQKANLSTFNPAAQMTDNSVQTIEEYIRRRASQWI